jgi:hypothetical protein
VPDSFVTLWTLERCRWLERVEDRGPLEVIFGGPHISLPSIAAVRVGDIIYPVMVKQGNLHVVARLQVEALTSPEDYMLSRHGLAEPRDTMWDVRFANPGNAEAGLGHRFPTTCCDMAAVGSHGSDIRFDRVVPGALLEKIRLGPRKGREVPLKGVEGARMKNNFSLQGHVRRLSSESAALFAELFVDEGGG